MVNIWSLDLWFATIAIAAFGLLQWLNLPTSNLLDWIVLTIFRPLVRAYRF